MLNSVLSNPALNIRTCETYHNASGSFKNSRRSFGKSRRTFGFVGISIEHSPSKLSSTRGTCWGAQWSREMGISAGPLRSVDVDARAGTIGCEKDKKENRPVSLEKRDKEALNQLRAKGLPHDLDWIVAKNIHGYQEIGNLDNTAQVNPLEFTTGILALAKDKGFKSKPGLEF